MILFGIELIHLQANHTSKAKVKVGFGSVFAIYLHVSKSRPFGKFYRQTTQYSGVVFMGN